MPIHDYYDKITDYHRAAVDEAIEEMIIIFRKNGIKMNMNDPVERVAEAMAKFIVESKT